jgi:hypothetical protein
MPLGFSTDKVNSWGVADSSLDVSGFSAFLDVLLDSLADQDNIVPFSNGLHWNVMSIPGHSGSRWPAGWTMTKSVGPPQSVNVVL